MRPHNLHGICQTNVDAACPSSFFSSRSSRSLNKQHDGENRSTLPSVTWAAEKQQRTKWFNLHAARSLCTNLFDSRTPSSSMSAEREETRNYRTCCIMRPDSAARPIYCLKWNALKVWCRFLPRHHCNRMQSHRFADIWQGSCWAQ